MLMGRSDSGDVPHRLNKRSADEGQEGMSSATPTAGSTAQAQLPLLGSIPDAE
jgi:hypothetical protein